MTPTQQRLLAAAPVIAFLTLGAVVYRSTHAVRNADLAVAHTNDVMRVGDSLLIRMLDAETGQRGYIITANKSYLAPYIGAEDDVFNHIRRLRGLTTDNPIQSARIDKLDGIVRRRFQILSDRVEMMEDGGSAVAAAAIASGKGKTMMDSARVLISDIDKAERELLLARTADSNKSLAFLQWGAIIGILLTAAITIIMMKILSNYAHEQAEARLMLEEQATELEMQQTELEAQQAEVELHAEMLEEQRDLAEEANRAKTEFLTAMSHELRTPLNAVIGYSELVATGVHGPVNQQQSHSLERVRISAQYLLTLINDVLSFAKINTGKIALDIREVDTGRVLANVDSFLRPQAEAKGISFNVTNKGGTAEADVDRLQQILLNLVGNAVKFTDAGGRIDINVEAKGDHIFFRVSDTGCGIPAEKLDSIFDPFVQLRRDPSHGSQAGVGLGLAISRELARAMGGDIFVNSELGKGSQFELGLPAKFSLLVENISA